MNKTAILKKRPATQTVNRLWVALILSAGIPLSGEAATALPTEAGTILQQVSPQASQPAASDKTQLKQKQQEAAEISSPPGGTVAIKAIKITGNSLFSEEVLHALVTDAEGKTLDLTELNKVARRLSEYYHRHGHTMTQTIIPAQKIVDGLITFQIIEAKYGKISLDNHSLVNDPLLQATLAPLQGGDPINQNRLDNVLLLLSDIPGEATQAMLQPGETVGTSDLTVNTTSVPALNGNISADNYGNAYTGKNRIGGTLNYLDPLHHGDILTLGVLTSGTNMKYGRLSYETLLNGRGTRTGVALSSMHYTLGGDLTSLLGYGTASVTSAWAKHPLIRTPNLNTTVQLQYDRKQLDDRIDSANTDTNRHLNNLTASLSGDTRDRFGAGAVTTWSLGAQSGNTGFDNTDALQNDQTTANTAGNYIKYTASMARLQGLSETNTLYLSWTWQSANRNLDSSEKLIGGGPYTVRAYSMGVLSGDNGYLGTLEIRHTLSPSVTGQWQLIAFIDSEQLTVNRSPWTTSANTASLSGGGIGLNWTGPAQWNGRAYVATPVGPNQTLISPAASTTGWIQINKGF